MNEDHICDLDTVERVVDILDVQADGPLGEFPSIAYHIKREYCELSFKGFRDAVNRTATHLRNELDGYARATPDGFVPVGYLSQHGQDLGMNLFGLFSLNVTPIVLSPRNSVEIMVHLLKASGALSLVYDVACEEAAMGCRTALPDLKLIQQRSLEASLGTEHVPKAKPLYSDQDAREHIFMVLHSSGSTSYPKLIHLSNRYSIETVLRLRQDEVKATFGTQLALAPHFHIFGITYLFLFLFNGANTAFPREKMPTPRQVLVDAVDTGATFITTLPFQLKQMAEYCDETEWAPLSKVACMTFGGATLPSAIHQKYLSHGISLLNQYGTTETGFMAFSLSSREGPQVLSMRKSIHYDLFDIHEGTAQLRILPSDKSLASNVCKSSEGYVVGDRLKLVRFDKDLGLLEFDLLGRVDDTIVHITGEKTNPVPIEETLLTLPLINKCVMFGSKRLNSCLFVELTKEAAYVSINEIVSLVNAQVDKANSVAPSHSRIDHSLVYILPLETSKHLPVTAKGNVARAKAEVLFQEEIRQLYSKFDQVSIPLKAAPKEMNFDSISRYINQAFFEVTKKQIQPDVGFFDQGMDSLLAVKFRNILHSAYPTSNITVNSIYEAENSKGLTDFILNLKEEKNLGFYQKQVDSFIQEYSNFPKQTEAIAKSGGKLNVLVTGANGSLGSFIIKSLLDRPDIGTIFSLARASTKEASLERIWEGFQERGIQISPDEWSQIQALPYVSDDKNLGLDKETYHQVFQSVEVIYHVAWRMDFLKGLPSFRDCVESTVHLLKISATSPRRPAFHFTSTVGATMPTLSGATIPEKNLTSTLENINFCNGYNLSKLVSEILCCKWSEHFGFPLDLHRVGQISGDTENGAWNTREHVSLLIKAAQVMKMIPLEFSESVTWIPVDVAAKGMVELHFSPNNTHQSTVNHIVNPTSTPWKEIISHIQALGIECQAVDSDTFLESLRSNQEVHINPIASLTDFFTKVLRTPPSSMTMETHLTSTRSQFIAKCPPVNGPLIKKYLEHWSEVGFIKL